MKHPPTRLREYQVRHFAAEDLDKVIRLVRETIDACYPAVYPAEAIECFKEYHSEAHVVEDAREGYTVVVEVDRRIIGTGTLLGGKVRRVFVHPAYQHLGFGKLIMRVLEERAAAKGVHAIGLSSSLVSKGFYNRLGYATEKRDSFPVGNGKELIHYAMARDLDGTALIVPAEGESRLAAFRSLCEEYAGSLEFDLGFQGFEEEMRGLPGDYARPFGNVLLALWRGEPAGCVALRPLDDRACEMKRLFVRPAQRRQGIGRELAREAIDEARRIGYQWMRLDTAPGMNEAQALYRSLGFRTAAPYYPNPIPGARYMELEVGAFGENKGRGTGG